jgi:thioredoxin reductase
MSNDQGDDYIVMYRRGDEVLNINKWNQAIVSKTVEIKTVAPLEELDGDTLEGEVLNVDIEGVTISNPEDITQFVTFEWAAIKSIAVLMETD